MSVQQPPQDITMVAVDKDKNSRHAFRWALNHLYNPVIIAVHVKHKNIPNRRYPFIFHIYNITYAEGTNVFPPDEEDVANIFNTLRGMCDRKSVKMKEAVIDDSDVVRGLLEFANRNVIHSIVIGASTVNPLQSLKKSKGYSDIPTAIIKSVPDYCYVYIISKLKIVSARPAIIRPMAKTFIPPNLQAFPPSESENVVRAQELRSGGVNEGPEAKAFEKSNDAVRTQVRERQRSAGSNLSIEKIDLSGRRHRSMDDRVISELVSMDVTKEDLDALGTSSASQSSGRAKELEAEMKKLRLELKQTMKMYSSACKQAISAKTQAEQIRQWKLEGERKVEEVWLSHEAALAMAEKEKARAKAALDAAEEAKKMAEQEAQRRKDVEMKARKETEERDQAFQNDNQYRKYTIEEIEAATQKFSPSKKVGEGGYGPVYKAQLDHTPVAIKILNPNATQGWKQFHQEIEVLSCIRHPNMVLLLGACPEHGCLVYEYMDNGSLEDRLFRKGNSPPISWRKRFQIAAEIAIALLFLHQTKPEPIVHRDLKPANILLNRNYVTKISDVGLARLVPPSVADTVTQYYMTSAAGTFCYIDPEYQQTGILTTKSDIYSLGIMLLQIITAKPPMGLAHHVRRAIKKDKFPEILDPVVTDWPVEEALSFAKLALSCAELSKKDRPSLATVVLPELNRLSDLGCNLRNNQVISSDDQSKSQATLPPTPTLSQLSKTLTRS
ncbi:U-box domain-containing protein 52-like [Gastrolobium bilobum]|uniref:U-box domain-containing protein 52-like n=1 Tax=Gastrolobium bilobum TaxID=150636 RepID=UPI002AB18CD0|nr:U-box domain-containing protein 52-like [Gastrolobium bilobum]